MIVETNIVPVQGIELVISRFQQSLGSSSYVKTQVVDLTEYSIYPRVFIKRDLFYHYTGNGQYTAVTFSDGTPRMFFELKSQKFLGNLYESVVLLHVVSDAQVSLYPIIQRLRNTKQYVKPLISDCTPTNVKEKLLFPKSHQTITITIKHGIEK